MSASRANDVIGAIDALLAECVEPAPVRFSPNGLSDREIEDFITESLARGEGGMGSAAPVAAPPAPRPTRSRAPRRRTATHDPIRFNRYAAACSECGETVPAQMGLLTRRGRKWVVTHSACPTDIVERAAELADTANTVDTSQDCYVVTVEVEVIGVRNPREAALLAVREVFTGEVTVTVADEDGELHEVNVTM